MIYIALIVPHSSASDDAIIKLNTKAPAVIAFEPYSIFLVT